MSTRRINLRPARTVAQETKKPKKSGASAVPEGKARLNLQIDETLKSWAMQYAVRKETSMTQLITDYFVKLRDEEAGDGVPQI